MEGRDVLTIQKLKQPKVTNYRCKIAPPQVFDWVLNTPPEQEIMTKQNIKIS